MPPSMTVRQREYLDFIREYIRENEKSPSLKEITAHFEVKAPTAHKTLQALMNKGFLYFERSSEAGFYIRLIERAGAAESVFLVPIAGKINRQGEVYDFPEHHGSFPTVLPGAKPDDVFALVVTEDIPQASLNINDFIIFDRQKMAQSGDICIGPIGERFFLIHITGKTPGDDMPSPLLTYDYPIPENLIHPEHEEELHWFPLDFDEVIKEMGPGLPANKEWMFKPFPPDWMAGTALRLIRALHFKRAR